MYKVFHTLFHKLLLFMLNHLILHWYDLIMRILQLTFKRLRMERSHLYRITITKSKLSMRNVNIWVLFFMFLSGRLLLNNWHLTWWCFQLFNNSLPLRNIKNKTQMFTFLMLNLDLVMVILYRWLLSILSLLKVSCRIRMIKSYQCKIRWLSIKRRSLWNKVWKTLYIKIQTKRMISLVL
jgi:hypothetical protein